MSKGQKLRALVNERLTAAAEEIFELFERTIAEYEEEVHTLKQRNNTQLLDPGVQIVSVKSEEELGPSLDPPHMKEEPEEEQLQEFPFTPVSVKTEDDENKSSVLHQRPTEENREETNGEECGAEAGCSSDPHLHSDSEGHSSDHTDPSEDWTQEQTPSKRSFATNTEPSVSVVGNTKPYSCSVCGRSFLRKDHLREHALVHSGERPFKCLFCEKTFTRMNHLKIHTRSHTGERPFSCSSCDKTFTSKCLLVSHMRVHTGDRPFRCTQCHRDFRQKSHLRAHLKIHNRERSFSCSVCHQAFSAHGLLTGHFQSAHPGNCA